MLGMLRDDLLSAPYMNYSADVDIYYSYVVLNILRGGPRLMYM